MCIWINIGIRIKKQVLSAYCLGDLYEVYLSKIEESSWLAGFPENRTELSFEEAISLIIVSRISIQLSRSHTSAVRISKSFDIVR